MFVGFVYFVHGSMFEFLDVHLNVYISLKTHLSKFFDFLEELGCLRNIGSPNNLDLLRLDQVVVIKDIENLGK